MATQTKTKASDAIPSGFKQLDNFATRMDIEVGLEFLGTLGPISPSKKVGFKDYRTIRVTQGSLAPGLYFLPTHAALTCLMEYPVGTECFCRLTGGSGETEDPYTWTVAVKG